MVLSLDNNMGMSTSILQNNNSLLKKTQVVVFQKYLRIYEKLVTHELTSFEFKLQ